ncbi:MAG: hypothetical protein P1U89_24385 [Verrucomicrobiales bacterium]|nr:hypothetical protein [Verrucomicrobiales bacterium]
MKSVNVNSPIERVPMSGQAVSPEQRESAPGEVPGAFGLSKAHNVTFLKTGNLIQSLDPLYVNPNLFQFDDIGIIREGKNGQPDELVGVKRGTVRGFSPASRRRMFKLLATLGDSVPVMVTLTYRKAQFPEGKEVLKAHFKKFWQMVQRKYRGNFLGCIWKIELQKSGVPHFHLLVYSKDGTQPFIDHVWLAKAWAKASEDESPDHIKAGTRVEAIRSCDGALSYAAKYLGKVDQTNWCYGRVWGCRSKNNLPICETEEIELDECEREAYEKHCVHIHASRKARAQAYDEFPVVFTAEDIKEIGKPAIWLNEEAQEWRERIEDYYYDQSVELFKSEPWRASYWTILKPEDFERLCQEARTFRNAMIEFTKRFLNGEFTFDASRSKIA